MNEAAPNQTPLSAPRTTLTVRALVLGERIETAGLERADAVGLSPMTFRAGEAGWAVIFRHGAVALAGLSPLEEDAFIRDLAPRITKRFDRPEEETVQLVVTAEREDQAPPGGPVQVRDLSPERLIVVADALSKSASLARAEREASGVFDVVEPFATRLAETGRTPGNRRELMRLIGRALTVQQQLAGRVEVEEKPDVLWDRPDLERLYARLEDEYELKERSQALSRKLNVIGDSARTFTDLIDTKHALRLEWAIVLLIVFEVVMTIWDKLSK